MGYFCSVCKSDIKEAEFKYSMEKYGQALCREHQNNSGSKYDNSNSNNIPKSQDSDKLSNFSKRDGNFVESMIKGRIAETLVEELFLHLDYSVYRFGMENTIPGIMEQLRGVKNDVTYTIRKMPDFVVQNKKTGEVFFIEVKFRKNETFELKDAGEDYPYENCHFVVVSKNHIKCITYKELKEGKAVTPTSRNYLGSRKEFELDKEVIIQFCDFAVKFFSVVE
ncbi:hypothetical protein FTO70_12195 [Methanosarcina sp. KYL-1]|uniref:hypothetical protein n=1 Tax=Methanosarcina sp. KYL-1 TaxID=2602068 RepID=UPI0021014FC1|nr:hypothetical protein [Methanosarcina sp. KYL-1]MCQ1536420.1 hypothetical protein [Methanosarcina sp. KYL-1]